MHSATINLLVSAVERTNMPNLKDHIEIKQHYTMNNSLHFLSKPLQTLN